MTSSRILHLCHQLGYFVIKLYTYPYRENKQIGLLVVQCLLHTRHHLPDYIQQSRMWLVRIFLNKNQTQNGESGNCFDLKVYSLIYFKEMISANITTQS